MAGPLKYEAAIALWKITKESNPALAVLVEGLKSKTPHTRLSIVGILKKLHGKARDEVSIIAEMVEKDESPSIRARAVEFLAAFANEVPEAKSALRRALTNDKYVVRAAATNALRESSGSSSSLNRK